MLFVLAVGILLDGIYNLVGYLCRWRHIYLCYQSMCHTKMTPSRIEWDRMTKKDAKLQIMKKMREDKTA